MVVKQLDVPPLVKNCGLSQWCELEHCPSEKDHSLGQHQNFSGGELSGISSRL